MSNVVDLPVITRLNLNPERVLQAALDAEPKLTEVVVIGWTEDGQEYMVSSISNGPEVVWLAERLKHRLVAEAETDT